MVEGTSQFNDISSIGLLLLLLIVVIASLFFLRGVLCYLHKNRLGNNMMDSASVVTSSQEDYVLKGKSVISSNLVRTPPSLFSSFFISRLPGFPKHSPGHSGSHRRTGREV
jgi:hypothetical protein